jgi:hypothetical protein
VAIDFTDSATGSVGEQASVTVTATVSSLSGFGLLEVFLPSQLERTAVFKLEQPSSSWDSGSEDGTC